MLKIGIYPRKSVFRDNSESVSVQVKMCKEYASIIYRDQEIEFHIYDKDEGFSGKNTNRPSYQELIRDVCQGSLDVIIVYKLDRISRNVQEFSTMFGILQKHNVSFISVKETFDTSTPIGRTVMYILAAFAQLERENTSERVSDNMQALGASGKWTGGNCPAGFTSVRRESGGREHSYLIVDTENIWRVKLIYDLLLSGYTITGLERYCRDHSITSQTGKFLSTSQLYNIISNPVYCQADLNAYYYFQELGCGLPENTSQFDGSKGLMAYGRTKTGDTTQQRTHNSSWHINVGIHDWVIPSDQWQAAQKRLGQNKHIRSNKYKVGILKGVLRCKCGSKMANRVYMKNGIQFAYYYCEGASREGADRCLIRYYRIQEIDTLFIDQLKEIRLNPQDINIQSDKPADYQEPGTIRSDIRSTESAITNLTIRLQENAASSAAKYIIEQIEHLDKKLSTLNSSLRLAELRQIRAQTQAQQQKTIFDNICFLLDNFDNMEYNEKNEIIRKITKQCILDGEHLTIMF